MAEPGVNIYKPTTLTSNWFADRYEPDWQDKVNEGQYMVKQSISRWTQTSKDYGANVTSDKQLKMPNVNWLQYDMNHPRYTTSTQESYLSPKEQSCPFEIPSFRKGERALGAYRNLWTCGEQEMFRHYKHTLNGATKPFDNSRV